MSAPEKSRNLVFGLNRPLKTLTVFLTRSDAIAAVEGLEIAEGDWCFFAADGVPLEARFSTPPRVDHEKNTYTNSVYTLEPAAGDSDLFALLKIVACDDAAQSGLHTLRDVEEFLLDRMLGEDL